MCSLVFIPLRHHTNKSVCRFTVKKVMIHSIHGPLLDMAETLLLLILNTVFCRSYKHT